LDVTTVRDRPPGRREISTSRVTGARGRVKMWAFVREQLTAGRQAYVICPRVEADDDDREAAVPASVEAAGPLLAAGELKEVAGSDPVAVATIHGRLSPEDKEARMADFRDGRTRVLVSTTVVEGGVDVPNATVMVILRPERFGLSQLHQLRGRVGRGSRGGYCFLLPENESEEASARLSVLERTNDGFKVAEEDAELRGPGDVLGTRQSGGMPLRVADLSRDAKVLTEAREAAFEWVASGAIDRPGSADLRRIVWGRFGEALELPPAG
ncbi:MAG: helicase-related protein, partial [Planctomycetota bacterium]